MAPHEQPTEMMMRRRRRARRARREEMPATVQAMTDAPERIAKRLARAGVASRRGAEAMIAEGRVAVNGRVIDSPALNVTTADGITVDGRPLAAPEAARLWRYYKPIGLVTSEADEKGRDTVFAHLPRGTAAGGQRRAARPQLRGPAAADQRRRAEAAAGAAVDGLGAQVPGAGARATPDDAALEPLRRGITVDGERFAPMSVTIDRQQGANVWLTVGAARGPQPRGPARARHASG